MNKNLPIRVIKHWGLSGMPSASLAGKFSNGG